MVKFLGKIVLAVIQNPNPDLSYQIYTRFCSGPQKTNIAAKTPKADISLDPLRMRIKLKHLTRRAATAPHERQSGGPFGKARGKKKNMVNLGHCAQKMIVDW